MNWWVGGWAGGLVRWLLDCMIAWLAGSLVRSLIGWLVGCLFSGLVGLVTCIVFGLVEWVRLPVFCFDWWSGLRYWSRVWIGGVG